VSEGIRPLPATAFMFLALVAACCLSAGCLHAEKTAVSVTPNASLEITRFMGVYGGSSFLVFGEARNTGEVPLEKVVLVVDFLDAGRGKVASKAIESPGPIPVNGTWDFEVSLDGPPAAEVRFYEITTLYR